MHQRTCATILFECLCGETPTSLPRVSFSPTKRLNTLLWGLISRLGYVRPVSQTRVEVPRKIANHQSPLLPHCIHACHHHTRLANRKRANYISVVVWRPIQGTIACDATLTSLLRVPLSSVKRKKTFRQREVVFLVELYDYEREQHRVIGFNTTNNVRKIS